MKRSYYITIPEPCHENWQGMIPVENGRFCASCQKKVFDFTTASDKEIIKALNRNDNLCGRFRTTQLNRDLVVRKEKNSFWIAASTAILSFLSIGNSGIQAQEKAKTEQTDQKKSTAHKKSLFRSNKEMIITGTVTEAGLPLPGASIVLQRTAGGTQTDMDGNFSIKAKKGDILVFTFIGMKDARIEITSDKKLIVDMKASNENIECINVTAGAIKRRKVLKP